MPDMMDALVKAMARYAKADAAVEVAWGDKGDGRSALPQAEQLVMRIATGKDMRGTPRMKGHEAELEATITSLEMQLAAKRRDPGDRRRCLLWQAAMAEYQAALDAVVPLYTEGERLYGDRLGAALAGHTSSRTGLENLPAGAASHAQGGFAL